jgi:hypothetical protein
MGRSEELQKIINKKIKITFKVFNMYNDFNTSIKNNYIENVIVDLRQNYIRCLLSYLFVNIGFFIFFFQISPPSL